MASFENEPEEERSNEKEEVVAAEEEEQETQVMQEMYFNITSWKKVTNIYRQITNIIGQGK